VSLPAAVRIGMLGSKSRGPVARGADDFPTGSDYGAQVYARTATLLETVARVYGRDELRAALGRYAREQRFEHPTPDDMLAVMATDLGEDVAKQMRIALFDEGWVDYEVAWVQSGGDEAPKGVFGDPDAPAAAPAPGEGKRGYVMVRRYGTLSFPVEIALHDAKGDVTQAAWNGQGDHHIIPWEGDENLSVAVIDPAQRILLDEDLSNNARRAHGRTHAAPRVWGHVAWVMQLLMGVASP
jgi:hypothetical protein